MDDTIRELNIQEWETRAAVIRTTGSPQEYATDCGQKVLRAQKPYGENDLPCTVIWPGPEISENIPGKNLCTMEMIAEGLHFYGSKAVAEGFATVDEAASIVGERILGDLKRCFGNPLWDRRRLITESPPTYEAPYASSIVYKEGGPAGYDIEEGFIFGAYAKFEITYWTKLGDPYTQ